MGKKANEKRKAWVEEVKRNDKQKKRPGKFTLVPRYTKEQKKPRDIPPAVKPMVCCVDKHESLPESFRRCIDCPKDGSSVADTDNVQERS